MTTSRCLICRHDYVSQEEGIVCPDCRKELSVGRFDVVENAIHVLACRAPSSTAIHLVR